MLVLGIDTSTAQVGVALGTDDGLLAQVCLVGSRRHAEQLAPAIEYVLGESGREVGELDVVAVGVGPGLFTGLRVGVTTAKMMASALDIPVVPVSSLDLVASRAAWFRGWVVAVTDARRGEVYTARYRAGDGRLDKAVDDRVVPPDALGGELAALDGPVLLVGSGVRPHADSLVTRAGIEPAPREYDHPSPAALVGLAVERHAGGAFVAARALRPVYLRQSDAERQAAAASG